MRVQLDPMPDSGVREEIEAEAVKYDWASPVGSTLAADSFSDKLPEKLGTFEASDAVKTGARESSEGHAAVATREYKAADKSELRIKVTDTSEIGSLRASLHDQLTVMGHGTNGDQTGAMIAGHPGMVAFDAGRRVSRAAILVRGRFLVEAMVRNTDKSAAAREALAALPLDSLPQPQQGDGKKKKQTK